MFIVIFVLYAFCIDYGLRHRLSQNFIRATKDKEQALLIDPEKLRILQDTGLLEIRRCVTWPGSRRSFFTLGHVIIKQGKSCHLSSASAQAMARWNPACKIEEIRMYRMGSPTASCSPGQ